MNITERDVVDIYTINSNANKYTKIQFNGFALNEKIVLPIVLPIMWVHVSASYLSHSTVT